MNKDIFLNCLAYTGVETGTSVIGLYSFNSGLSGACFNQIYSTGYNYYNNLPYNGALPLIYNGIGHQPSGNFSLKDVYHINKTGSGNFNILISMNYSGCLNTGDNNYILFSTASGINNSGIALGITPSNRLFLIAPQYFSTISKEITPTDFAFIGVESNRFVNFGLFNIKENSIYNKVYDKGLENINVEKLYFGGLLSYPSGYTGYSGNLNEVYLFSGNLSNSFIRNCIQCSYVTGFSYDINQELYTGISITGSYWTGVKENQITGSEKKIGNFSKTDGTIGNFYYDSGLTGNIEVYQFLNPLYQNIPSTGYTTGVIPNIDIEKKYSQTKFDLFFDLGLKSGDIIEIYTYKEFNSNVNLEIINNIFPNSNNYVQLFGNGLAETKSGESQYFIDYYTGLNGQFNKISNFDESDVLIYDLTTGNSVTASYSNSDCVTGEATSNQMIDLLNIKYIFAEVNSLENIPPFIYDLYLNGKKLISGFDYIVTGVYDGGLGIWSNHIYLSGDNSLLYNLTDSQELKLVVFQKNYIRNLFQITGDTYYLTGLSGFSEQIWKNGIRQKNGIDYFIKNYCSFYTGDYLNPPYSFELLNSTNSFINEYITPPNYVYLNAQNQVNLLTQTLSNNPKKLFSNADYIDYETQKSIPFCFFSGSGVGKNLYITDIVSGTIKTGIFILGGSYQNQIITGFINGIYGETGVYSTNIEDTFSKKLLTGYAIPIFERNTGCWAYPLGKELTCISPWNSHSLVESNTRSSTLITPQHILSAYHFPPISAGNTIVFVTEDNQILKRYVVDHIHFSEANNEYQFTPNLSNDLVILLLDSPLPDSIKPCSILPSDYTKYLNLQKNSNIDVGGSGYQHVSPEVCGLFLDKQKQALVGAMSFYLPLSNEFKINGNMNIRPSLPTGFNQSLLYEIIIQGDSGSPLFLIIDGKLCLIAIFTSGSSNREPLGEFIKYFNSGIQMLKQRNPTISLNNYSLTEFDFSEFDKKNNYNLTYDPYFT